jgi:hypothetical protein
VIVDPAATVTGVAEPLTFTTVGGFLITTVDADDVFV